MKALRVDLHDPTSHNDSPSQLNVPITACIDILWTKSFIQYIISFNEDGYSHLIIGILLVYPQYNEQLTNELQIISSTDVVDISKRGKSKHHRPSIRIVDDEDGMSILKYDQQWSIFRMQRLISWSLDNRSIILGKPLDRLDETV